MYWHDLDTSEYTRWVYTSAELIEPYFGTLR